MWKCRGGHRRFPRAKLRIKQAPTEILDGGGKCLESVCPRWGRSGNFLRENGNFLEGFGSPSGRNRGKSHPQSVELC